MTYNDSRLGHGGLAVDGAEMGKEIGAEEPLEAGWPAGLVAGVSRLGLGSCARLVLESVRPVSWLGAQALWLAQPPAPPRRATRCTWPPARMRWARAAHALPKRWPGWPGWGP